MPKTMEEVLKSCWDILDASVNTMCKALRNEGYIHKDSVKRLNKKELADFIYQREYEGKNVTKFGETEYENKEFYNNVAMIQAKAICDKFSTEIKLPEKKEYPDLNVKLPNHSRWLEAHAHNTCIDLTKKMNGGNNA